MGLLNLFNNKIKPTRILICSIADEVQLKQLADADAVVYKKYYPKVVVEHVQNAEGLMTLLKSNGFDVVHLLANSNEQGYVDGLYIRDILSSCSNGSVKVFFWAASTAPDIFIKHFKARALNMVMLIDRKGDFFTNFLDRLLAQMSTGVSMPMAWVKLVPQSPNAPEHATAPASIFQAGCGNMVFLP